MIRSIFVFLLIASAAAVAQNKTPISFVLDKSKPYVFIEFDRAGKRQPVLLDESDYGVWLRFVNNCRVPITIGTFGTGTDDPGVGVLHDVVQIPAAGYGGYPEPAGTRRTPFREPPMGYNNIDVHSLMTVYPGKSVLFSVPLEHLSPHWYIRVEFNLEVSKDRGDQPNSYANFYWDKLPKEVRSLKK